ncbi:MAG TPA: endonuclease V, partial [Nitrososphaerales archaeon]|nr:endonuclease V [Nitrososphaerales archaeon]
MSLRWKGSRRNSARPGELPDEAELRFFEGLQDLISLPSVALPKEVKTICAADAAYRGRLVVSAATLSVNGTITKSYCYRGRFTIPYVSGLFYMHEGPFVVAAIEGLRSRPQLLCFDAHGGAHPRSAGLATVAGMVLGIPSVGVAKSLLVGRVEKDDGSGLEKIVYGGRVVGFATGRGRERRYWSPGYSVTTRSLNRIISVYREACMNCLAEAHR